MLTPFNTRLSFIWYWLSGMMCAYLALFTRLQKESVIPLNVTYALVAIAVVSFGFGFIKLKKWFMQEDAIQRGASMLIQAKTENPEVVLTEIKKALQSKDFLNLFEKGVIESKWTIHNDTSLKHAKLRVEFNFPESWINTPHLWCALGMIAGTLPEGYKWGSTGRDNTKVVLTVSSPDGTTKTARFLANLWIQNIKNTVCTRLRKEQIEETYDIAHIPETKSKRGAEAILTNPPTGEWSVMASLPKEKIVIRISSPNAENEYSVLIADPTNSRMDTFKSWTTVLQTWGSFPEVKTALLEKFNSLAKK